MEEKTKKHVLRKILFVILIVFIIFLALTLRKFIIFNKIENLTKDKINTNNYYSEKISITGITTTIAKSYNKGDKYYSELRTFSTATDEKRGLIVYKNNDEKLAIIQSGENKIAFINTETIIGGDIRINILQTDQMNIWQKLLLSAVSRITTEECNSKKCYLIEPAKGWKLWIDKETGLVVREINGSTMQDSYYKFDIVTDNDIVKPDLSDCKIQEN